MADIPTLTNSDIENVDYAVYNWLNDYMNIHCNTNDGFNKVPVLWTSAERSFQIKNNKEIRDEKGALIPPLITIERTGIVKSGEAKGGFFNSLPNANERYIAEKITDTKKTSQYANNHSLLRHLKYNVGDKGLNNKNDKVLYRFKQVIIPVRVQFDYKISFVSQFQQQMNEMVQPLLTKNGSTKFFSINHENHTFEAFLDQTISQSDNVNNLESEERRYNSSINLKVYGHIVGENVNQDRPYVKIRENIVEVKVPRERIMTSWDEE